MLKLEIEHKKVENSNKIMTVARWVSQECEPSKYDRDTWRLMRGGRFPDLLINKETRAVLEGEDARFNPVVTDRAEVAVSHPERYPVIEQAIGNGRFAWMNRMGRFLELII